MVNQQSVPGQFPSARLFSLDAYRGLIMLALAFNGFGLEATAKRALQENPESSFWKLVQYQFSHVEWVGCALWDLIQPSFMFMVGVSMAYSYLKRSEQGDSWWTMFRHAVTRAIILVVLGIFLISNGAESTNWSLMNVLTQIGLGYVFLFLMWRRATWLQWLTLAGILLATLAAYQWGNTGGVDLEQGADEVGVSAAWAQNHLQAVPSAWHKNANLGHRVDLVVLNWLPQPTPFVYNGGGYQSINFFASLATMILGLILGELIRGNRTNGYKVVAMYLISILLVGAGLVSSHYGCPIVKRIWTPSWALFSGGICTAILASFFLVMDVWRFRFGAVILTVFGVNSIAVYVMYMLLRPWTAQSLKTHLGNDLFLKLGTIYEPLLQSTAVGCCFWLACYLMYRAKIFIRV